MCDVKSIGINLEKPITDYNNILKKITHILI